MRKDLEFLDIVKEYSELDPVSYEYFNQRFNHRTILFNRDVDEDIVETVYLPLKEFEDDTSDEPVTLILNSMGGSVSDGFFLANYLTGYKKKLKIIVVGYAASMAAVILAGGGKNPNVTRYCYPSTYGLIHDGYIAIAPAETKTAGDLIKFNDKVDANIRQFIIDHTNITSSQYDSMARKQWFLTAEEMKTYGLIDEIIGGDA